MAKEDFCFTYYDGDAARDMAHMNRLQRGAYTDLIIAIRKFGHISLDQVKMTLSKDFESCWPAIQMILKQDEEGNYYLEWLENSILKMRGQSKKQKDKINKYWTEKKQQNNHGNTTDIPQNNHGTPLVEPLEDGNGDGDNKIIKVMPEMTAADFVLFQSKLIQDSIFIEQLMSTRKISDMVSMMNWIKAFSVHISGEGNLRKDFAEFKRHFKNWIVKQDISKPPTVQPSVVQSSESPIYRNNEALLDKILGK